MAPTMAPTSWDAPSYDASALVEELHGYSHTEDDETYNYNGDMYAWVWGLTIMCGSFLMIVGIKGKSAHGAALNLPQ